NVPERPTTVAVLGSVKNPGTQLARRGASSGDYLRFSGGASREADLKRSYVLRANGAAVRYGGGLRVEPGDALIVAPRPASNSNLARYTGNSARWLLDTTEAIALIVTAVRR